LLIQGQDQTDLPVVTEIKNTSGELVCKVTGFWRVSRLKSS
jgi:hypothetical protein